MWIRGGFPSRSCKKLDCTMIFKFKILILEVFAVDAFPTRPVVVYEIPPLHHKVINSSPWTHPNYRAAG